MPQKTEQAIIFDMGGVLLQYQHQAVIAALAKLCHSEPETVRQTLNHHATALGTGAKNGRFLYHTLQTKTGLTADYDAFLTAVCTYPRRNDTALAYAVELAKRPFVTVSIISNTVQPHADWMRHHLPELNQFHPVIFSNDVGLLKPDPAIYQLTLSQLRLPPHHTLFIDDTLPNVTAAQQLGLAAHHHQSWAGTTATIEAWLARH